MCVYGVIWCVAGTPALVCRNMDCQRICLFFQPREAPAMFKTSCWLDLQQYNALLPAGATPHRGRADGHLLQVTH